jgi:hypothetical protein
MKKILTLFLTITITIFGQQPAAAIITIPENPAEMVFSNTRFELIIPTFSFNTGNNLFSPGNINEDLTPDSTKQSFLDKLDNGAFKSNIATELKAGFTVGNFGVYVRPWFSSSTDLKSGIPELVFNGYESGKNYDFNGSNIEGIAAVSLDLSYAKLIRDENELTVSLGLTMHILHGLAVGKSKIISNNLTPDDLGQTNYTAIVDSIYGSQGDSGFSGKGFLMDLGVARHSQPWCTGIVIKNIGPALNWNGLTNKNSLYSGSITGGPNGPELSEPNSVDTEKPGVVMATKIPIIIQVYGERSLTDHWKWNLGIEKDLGNEWGGSTTAQFWTGLDWTPWKPLHLAGNFFYQGDQLGVTSLFGLKAGFFRINLAFGWNDVLHNEQSTSFNSSLLTSIQF